MRNAWAIIQQHSNGAEYTNLENKSRQWRIYANKSE